MRWAFIFFFHLMAKDRETWDSKSKNHSSPAELQPESQLSNSTLRELTLLLSHTCTALRSPQSGHHGLLTQSQHTVIWPRCPAPPPHACRWPPGCSSHQPSHEQHPLPRTLFPPGMPQLKEHQLSESFPGLWTWRILTGELPNLIVPFHFCFFFSSQINWLIDSFDFLTVLEQDSHSGPQASHLFLSIKRYWNHSHMHSFTYCPWLLSHDTSKVEQSCTNQMAHKA